MDNRILHKDSQKRILRLFPYLKNKGKINKLMIDDDSISYISIREVAKETTSLIIDHLRAFGIDPNEAVITDTTAGVGGNTISFAMNFKHVNAIEIDKLRIDYLKNNCNVYDLENISYYSTDCTEILGNLQHNIVFFDPPWGGKDYKRFPKLTLSLANIPIEILCNKLFDEKMEKNPEIVIFKIPKNYDLDYMIKSLTSKSIYLCELRKMNIVIVHNEKLKQLYLEKQIEKTSK